MRFLMLVNATQDSEARAMPEEKLIRVKASAHQELARTSMWLDASRPQDSSKGWCIEHSGKQRSFVDGPFVETKELIAGHNILDRPRIPGGTTSICSDQEGGRDAEPQGSRLASPRTQDLLPHPGAEPDSAGCWSVCHTTSYRSPATRHDTNPRAIEPSASMAGLKIPTFTPTA
jgi:hypothetical protein